MSSSSMEGHLRLGLLAEYVPGTLILRHLPGFRRLYPQVSFAVTFGTVASIEEGLVADTLSVGVVDREAAHDFLETVNIGTMPYVAVAARTYVQARGPLEKPEQVLLADLIDLGPHLPLATRWLGTGEASMLALAQHVTPAFVVPNFHAAREIMAGGGGVAFLPRMMVAEGLAEGSLLELGNRGGMESRPLQLVYRKRTARKLSESVFLEYLLDAAPFGVT